MKPIIEKQPPHVETELMACEVFRGPDFGCVWHQHPEVEIALVKRGGTERLVCDRLSPLEPVDFVQVGPYLPHDYRNVATPGKRPRKVDAIVIQVIGELPRSIPPARRPITAGLPPSRAMTWLSGPAVARVPVAKSAGRCLIAWSAWRFSDSRPPMVNPSRVRSSSSSDDWCDDCDR